MNGEAYRFPKGFLWGTASAAHQFEGANSNNQWWRWEQDGRTRDVSGLACDWWGGRWREDFDRAAATGQNALRLSVEWSRIQPAPDRWDGAAIEFYRNMLRGARQRGLVPLVTLHHFTDPLWVFDRGGWENPETVGLFERFVRRAVMAFGEFTNLWVTINEPSSYILGGWGVGVFPPGKKDLRQATYLLSIMARGHAAAYRAIHELQPNARVGYANHYRPVYPHRPWHPLDRILARVVHAIVNHGFPTAIREGVLRSPMGRYAIPEARGTMDYIGLNYYTSEAVRFDPSNRAELFCRHFFPPGSELSGTGFIASTPERLYEGLRRFTSWFPGLPLFILENGTEDAEDRTRPAYIARHLHQVWRAIAGGCPVRGYFHWALVDNFEWERGWLHRFGLWGLNPVTQERIRRPSVDLYAAICRENALTPGMADRYCPTVRPLIFPTREGWWEVAGLLPAPL